MLALHLDRGLEARLERIANESGHTRSWIVQQAVARYIEEVEARREDAEVREQAAA